MFSVVTRFEEINSEAALGYLHHELELVPTLRVLSRHPTLPEAALVIVLHAAAQVR
jgi:hypothetical protein